MHRSLGIFTEELYDGSLSETEYTVAIQAITKLIHLDTAVVVEAFTAHTSSIIAEQSHALIEMSTPVTMIWNNILMLPIVGIVDSKRSQDIMDAVLTKIGQTQAKSCIMDISGVAIVDTAVANHLIKITKATRLMGCECILSGISPAIAQTMVELGIQVGDIATTTTLRDALEHAFRATGIELQEKKRHPSNP